jgi:hypothetical protein
VLHVLILDHVHMMDGVCLQDASGMFPLMAAALRNHADIASLLLEAGATVDATDEWGRTVGISMWPLQHLAPVAVQCA